MLKLERVSKFYSANGLVSAGFTKVDLELDIGEFVAITGESGSGKSTLLNVISGLDSYEEGEMFILGEPTSGFSKEDLEEYRKKYIGNIFQTFNLINSYTVYQNVELVLLMSGYDKSEIPQKVKSIIERVGLKEYENTKASKLSGGQKQRVAIARALAKETPIIVADEPTGNLDSQSAADIIKLLHELSEDKLIIVVTHNYDQVEPYVTRKIAMYDGRVAEDKVLNEKHLSSKSENIQPKPAKADGLSNGSMLKLGIRNTFNIPAKFFLLLAVFIFLCGAVIAQYSSFMNMGALSDDQGYNEYFKATGKERILVTRQDKREFTEADYAKIDKVPNTARIVKNDLMMDTSAYVTDEGKDGNYNYYLSGKISESADFEGRLAEGRMPKNDKEVIIMLSEQEDYLKNSVQEAMEKRSTIRNQETGNLLVKQKVNVVGYGYLTEAERTALEGDGNYNEICLGFNDAGMENVRLNALERFCTQELEFGGKIVDGNSGAEMMPIRVSDKVEKGYAYIPGELAALGDGYPAGKELKLKNKSLYFQDTFKFTVTNAYNSDNLEYYLGLKNFDEVDGAIFIHPDDYNKMFNKGNFQSSVIISDTQIADQTVKELNRIGFDTFKVRDGRVSSSQGFDIVINTFRTVMLLFVLVVLFFISYFIVKLVFKSRNTYFSTTRMLGATKENCKALLRTELFIIFNIAFFICIIFAVLISTGVIPLAYGAQMLSYLSVIDYLILYVVLCAMAILLASRYARQLFKKTAMNAHKEEV